MQAELHIRVLPEQHVVLEVDGHATVERHVEHRDELALEPVPETGSGSLGDLGGQDLWRGGHLLSPSRVVAGGGLAAGGGSLGMMARA
jgi:hypothetical protein